MTKALGFVVFFFIGLVGLNWVFTELPLPPSLYASPSADANEVQAPILEMKGVVSSTAISNVPFYSQFKNIQSPQWQAVGCGITSLAMIIDFYKPASVSVNTLLYQGVAAGAYDENAGWTYEGLIQLSERYGLSGSYYDLSNLATKSALDQFRGFLKSGPLILSVYNKFDPESNIPHLLVIDGIKNDMVYYNDPAAAVGDQKISIANFLRGWKKKVIVLRPIGGEAKHELSLR